MLMVGGISAKILTSSAHAATLVWDPSSTPGVTYRIHQAVGSGSFFVIATTSNTNYQLGLTPNSTLYITAATSATNASDPSNFYHVPTPSTVVTNVVVKTNGTPNQVTNATVYLEAEAGVIAAPMIISTDALAAGSKYISTPTANAGLATFSVNVPAGTYVLWCRVRAKASNADSFFFTMDNGAEDIWGNESIISPNWQWTKLTGGNGGPVKSFNLAAGAHTMRFRGREVGVGLDALYLTSNMSFTPP